MKPEDSAPLLTVEHVSMCYHTPLGETAALSDISFQVKRGGFLAIVGPSGCGKSTILSLISGLMKPTAGQIHLAKSYSPQPIGYMLQHDHLFPWRTVWDNVCLGLELQNRLTSERKVHLMDLLEQYGLGEFSQRFPRHLSGGMRQRAALIRTLAMDPELLLLDEPFSALDYQTRIHVADDIAGIIRSQGKTAILVTHDISEAISLADEVLVLTRRPGRVRSLVPILLDDDDQQVMHRRQNPGFGAYFDRIWKEMNADDE